MIRKTLYTIGVILFVLSLIQINDFVAYKKERDTKFEQIGNNGTEALKNQVDEILAKISAEAKRLAEIFGSQELSKQEIERIIKESSLSIPEIQGVTACYDPFAFSKNERLYCPYYNKTTSDYFFVGKKYDYTVPNSKATAWYTDVRDHGTMWVEPYYGTGAEEWFVDFGIPFYFKEGAQKGKVRGTITMSIVCGGFNDLVHAMSLGKTGYGIITSQKNGFLAHPKSEYIGTKNLAALIEKEENTELKQAYNMLLEKGKGAVKYYDEEVEDEVLFFSEKIPTTGWGIGLAFYKKNMLKDFKIYDQKSIKLALLLSLFLICLLTIYFFRDDDLNARELWTLSLLTATIFLSITIFIGYLTHQSDAIAENESPPITDVNAVKAEIKKQDDKADLFKTPKVHSIPTGIYLRNLEFEDSYNVNVGGRIWQKYPKDLIDKVDVGFSLPQMSPFAEAELIEEVSREFIAGKEGEAGYVLVSWDIRVTLRLNLSYIDFPLDKSRIDIEIIPKNSKDRLFFTPDLTSYKFTNPDKKSGLNHKISISGSEVLESYFNYSYESFDSDFGHGTKALFEEVPVLHYHINIKRKLLNAFITYLVPIIVTMIMVFILILATGKTKERQGIIESMAAFFFVIIFSHIDLRKEIVTADLTYIEYFYFTTYFILILVTFNLISYSKKKNRYFDYEKNLLFKAAYFPLIFFITLLFTLWQFY